MYMHIDEGSCRRIRFRNGNSTLCLRCERSMYREDGEVRTEGQNSQFFVWSFVRTPSVLTVTDALSDGTTCSL